MVGATFRVVGAESEAMICPVSGADVMGLFFEAAGADSRGSALFCWRLFLLSRRGTGSLPDL